MTGYTALFLSTPSARRATCEKILSGEKTVISIHALREEGDACTHPVFDVAIVFLSTPSARRATSGDNTQSLPICDFYPRPPRGGRPSAFPPGRPGCRISIHALREEGDGFLAKMQTSRPYFYPRPPRGGRPYAGTPYHLFGRFLSTPSARRATEGDFLFIGWCCNFYPRPPRGGRRLVPEKKGRCRIFLSTPSARRATQRLHGDGRRWRFLSTPSARRATFEKGAMPYDYEHFYPRPPRGGRLRYG